jgi:hypothetical protein
MTIHNLKTFTLAIYESKNINREPILSYKGATDDWLKYSTVRPRSFDESYTLNLEDFWGKVLTNQFTEYTETITGYATIIKFSNTMQLKHSFTAYVVCTY